MLDFDLEGPSSAREFAGGQPFDLSNADDGHSFILAIAKRDTDSQAKAKLADNLAVFNYGVHFTYRVQRNDAVEFFNQPFQDEGGNVALSPDSWAPRRGSLYIPDIWVKYERRLFRLELELAGVFGSFENRAQSFADQNGGANQALTFTQFGAVGQSEFRLMDGALKLGLEVGFASGDRAPGMGNRPRRRGPRQPGPDGNLNTPDDTFLPPQAGNFDGPQYDCAPTGGCVDADIRNFRFNRDYRIDMILWREILGSVTDAIYAKPTASYQIAEGFDIFAAIIYSRAVYPESTPSSSEASLGVEINAGAKYETEDGFFAQVGWGILFPLGGLADTRPEGTPNLDTAQAVRGLIGIKY
jgi:uncharacterized protein (TIGR04551 family)